MQFSNQYLVSLRSLSPSNHFPAATHPINQDAHGTVNIAILPERSRADQILADFFDNIGRTPASYRPFTTPVYSNVGYALLGLVVENVSGQSYADYVEQNIVKKAGMKHTSVTEPPASELGFIPAEPNWWGTSLGYKNR